jgi:hypothetical protein
MVDEIQEYQREWHNHVERMPLNVCLTMHFKVPVIDRTFFAIGYAITVLIISIKA